MNEKFVKDYERFCSKKYNIIPCILRIVKNHELAFFFWGRQNEQAKMKWWGVVTACILHHYRKKYGFEMNFKNVGGGIRFIHPWLITVNANAHIGENVTLFKGCTIGVIEKGKKAGNPTIGNNVTIYANATICGNIMIGDRSIISAGAFVNFDVPEDSTVIGNPGIIHNRNSRK